MHLSSPLTRMKKSRVIVKRLDRIDGCLQRLERDLEIASALFIRFWLNSAVPLTETAQAAARVKGGERNNQFIEALGRLSRAEASARSI
ncbi:MULTISPECIES: hypothetical protein [Mesorhizobium]|uniref:hypothetical protein n=1 Tax=Mesorhizobium TaxID=68287 RepID=UPI001FE8F655|nr:MULTISPECIES: hypothetical protein [Mesorhizobium]